LQVCDFLIIGSGIAGLYTALNLPEDSRVLVVTKKKAVDTNTSYAQGGIAAAVSKEDSIQLHYQDTLAAGDGLCNEHAVRVLVEEGPQKIKDLIKLGVHFDIRGNEPERGKEGAHSCNRILRCSGDKTGKVIHDYLLKRICSSKNIKLLENTLAIELIAHEGRCLGAVVKRGSCIERILAQAVIIAMGGICGIYERTTNSPEILGDGVALAFRAGAGLMDMEFVQFHPTAFFEKKCDRVFLISEAVRGEGGRLYNAYGERFMEKVHPLKELAPRDIVARAIFSQMKKTGKEFVWLDITHHSRKFLEKRFPTIYSYCMKRGIDISKDPIPVAPAAHYHMGGIKTDLNGKTNVPGLYACGEAACNGVHGANRLASNSLLEGLVFGSRTAQSAAGFAAKNYLDNMGKLSFDGTVKGDLLYTDKKTLKYVKKLMQNNTGIERDKKGLSKVLSFINHRSSFNVAHIHNNVLLVSYLVSYSAILREESRGCHLRKDFDVKRKEWEKHIVLKKGRWGKIEVEYVKNK